jgi:hypothetical protein
MCEGSPELLFKQRTNVRRIYGCDDSHKFVKDSINVSW